MAAVMGFALPAITKALRIGAEFRTTDCID
jgi:hypothetical protein